MNDFFERFRGLEMNTPNKTRENKVIVKPSPNQKKYREQNYPKKKAKILLCNFESKDTKSYTYVIATFKEKK